MRLSKTQQEALDQLKAGDVAYYARYMGRFRRNPYWYWKSNHKKCTKAIERLMELKLVTVHFDRMNYRESVTYRQEPT